MSAAPDWVEIRRGNAPVIVAMPHTGIEIPVDLLGRYVSPWLARKDTDWWLEQLYDFTIGLDITVVRTRISRSVIDANRDPSGASLYPGQTTTALCPVTTFDGALPNFNIGTNSGAACAPELAVAVAARCAGSAFSHVVDGRFKGGWTTRHLGNPAGGVHAIQMELACRGYMTEPEARVSEANWPTAYDFAYAAPLRTILREILVACIAFALVS